jgi:hypothetical protein
MIDDTEERAEALADEQGRAVLSAEALSPRMRIGLLLITMFGELLMLAFAIAGIYVPHGRGMLDYDPFLAVYLGGILVGMGFFLMVIYGGFVGHNPRLNEASRMVWFMSFAIIGPIALPAYWFIHVWTAPVKPWTNPELPHQPSVPRLQYVHVHAH